MKYLRISEVENQTTNESIWALNATAEVRAPGDLVVSIPKLNGGKSDALFLPATWLPTCLTDQIPRMQLLQSAEFRSAVNSGAIKLISPEDAEDLNGQFGAAQERERLNELAQRVAQALRANGVHSDDNAVVNEADTMDPSFIIFFDSVKERDDTAAYNALRGRGKFSRKELAFMTRHLVDKPHTLAFVAQLLDTDKAA